MLAEDKIDDFPVIDNGVEEASVKFLSDDAFTVFNTDALRIKKNRDLESVDAMMSDSTKRQY